MLTQKVLGKTDIAISPLGLGTVKFGRNTDVKYPHGFELPSDSDLMNLLSVAKDLGINLLDTAPAYGNSEQRLGKLLQGQRHDWVIVGKVGETYEDKTSSYNFTPDHIVSTVENSLKQLKTDFLDVLLIHSNGDDVNIINNYGVFDTLNTLKQKPSILTIQMLKPN